MRVFYADTFVLPLPPGLATGDHTLQINGLGVDGRARTASTGVVLEASSAAAALPVTGPNGAGATAILAFALLVGGAL